MSDRLSGGCLCGAVRYEVAGDPVWSAGCCCRDCARSTGTPFVVWVGFSPGNVTFTGDDTCICETSEGVLRGFCETCGTALTYGRSAEFDTDRPILYVAAATLDDPEAFPPTEVVWYAQRPSWFNLEPAVPLHDGVSPLHADRAYNSARRRRGE